MAMAMAMARAGIFRRSKSDSPYSTDEIADTR
jgi:hypothetical protein